MSRKTRLAAVMVLATAPPVSSLGHHTFAWVYNTSQMAEIEGEVIEVQWENPHVQFRMRAEDGMPSSRASASIVSVPHARGRRELV